MSFQKTITSCGTRLRLDQFFITIFLNLIYDLVAYLQNAIFAQLSHGLLVVAYLLMLFMEGINTKNEIDFCLILMTI